MKEEPKVETNATALLQSRVFLPGGNQQVPKGLLQFGRRLGSSKPSQPCYEGGVVLGSPLCCIMEVDSISHSPAD